MHGRHALHASLRQQELHLYRRAKALFSASRESLGSRELAKKLRTEGFEITRYRMMKIMRKLKLVVKQHVAYKVTTKRKHSDAVADNLLNQNFNPTGKDQVWAGDITYLKTAGGLVISSDHYGFVLASHCWLGHRQKNDDQLD